MRMDALLELVELHMSMLPRFQQHLLTPLGSVLLGCRCGTTTPRSA